MENSPQFDIEMLQNSAPYSVPFAQPQSRHLPPHFIPQQPSMYGSRGTTIPPRFLPSYQPPTARRGHFNHYNQPRREFWCESCDWSFFSEAKLEDHRKQHVKCSSDGCAFEGHPKILNKHTELHHSSGSFGKQQILDSPEDIAKWREERRKNYPTAKNVELRRKAQEEQKKRGERIPERRSRFGQRKDHPGRELRNQGKKRRNFSERKTKEPEQVMESEEITNQGVFMFRGTAAMEDYKNPLAKLLSAYGSASESEPEEETPPAIDSKQMESAENDLSLTEKPLESPGTTSKPEESVAEKSRKSKRKSPKTSGSAPPKKQTRIYEGLNYEFLRRRQPPTMLSRLLEKEIRHERNVVLQCIRFVVENNFLDNESK